MLSPSSTVVSVNPFRCCMWALHDRLENLIDEHTCRAEIASFLAHGQLMPVLGRPVRSNTEYDIELIFGARRLFVARHTGRPIQVELRDLTDREALIAMDIENRQRADISPYERGLSFARWLREGLFASQDDIARALRVSPSQVSRLLKLARLPTVVVEAFASPVDIREGWGLELVAALANERRRQPLLDKARALTAHSPRPRSPIVYRQLLAGGNTKRSTHDEVVKSSEGKPLFRIRRLRSSIALVLPSAGISQKSLNRIRNVLTEILDEPKRSAHSAGADDGGPRETPIPAIRISDASLPMSR
jgi:ParB family transcriptional regulator, chromosome partitioning protein